MGGTWCVCALGAGPQRLERREQFRTTTPGETIERIVAFFETGPEPVAVGIGSFGPADVLPQSPSWGSITSTPKPGWQNVTLAPTIHEALAVPVAFDTDVAAAAVAEHRWGAGRGLPGICYVTVGTGIGGGLLVDGRPWHGLVHPEVGHLRIPHDRERDSFKGICPAHGDCWEGLACGPAIEARWGLPGPDLPDDHPAWVLEAEYVALGLMAIVAVFSPPMIVLGGGVMDHAGLREQVRIRLRGLIGGYLTTSLLSERMDNFIVAPQLGDDAGVLGAIALAQLAV